jgi:hypothetical protein
MTQKSLPMGLKMKSSYWIIIYVYVDAILMLKLSALNV